MAYNRNQVVQDLTFFAYGQKGAVALPGSALPATIGQGRYPAGVDDVLQHLLDEYSKWETNQTVPTRLEWLFLVGGPGNGKSQALTTFAGALGLPLPNVGANQKVPRAIPLDWPNSSPRVCGKLEAVFINDASIPRAGVGQAKGGSLFHDLCDVISRLEGGYPTTVFANINRGILIEEIHALPTVVSGAGDKIARETICWLADPRPDSHHAGSSVSHALGEVTFFPKADSLYYGQLMYKASSTGLSHDVVVHAVFLDMLSLLEPTPTLGVMGRAIDLTKSPPSVAPYRPVGGLLPTSGCRDATIAGERTKSLATESKWELGECGSPKPCDAAEYCPYLANARWLRDQILRDRFLATMRAAEIASARRLTYRDLMGHLSLAVLGRLEEDWLRSVHPCDWVGSLHHEISQCTANKPTSVVKLLEHRIYSNIFCSTDNGVWNELGSEKQGAALHSALHSRNVLPVCVGRPEAFEKSFMQIDPARDVGPWRQDVLGAVDSIEIEAPSSLLVNRGVLPTCASGALEKTLDLLLANELSSMHAGTTAADATRRRALHHWRCVMLLRQIGLAGNNIAFKPAIEHWLEEQSAALNNNAPQTDLGNGLRSLVVQAATIGGAPRMLLAPLRPRTYVLGVVPPDTVVVELNPSHIQVLPVAEGDALLAEVRLLVKNQFEAVTRFPVDLAIAREAMMQVSSSGAGFTEIGSSTFARIERTRAVLIGRQRMSRGNIAFLGTGGKTRNIRQNPSGHPPFQVV